jgi:hypothetical protein
MTLANSQPVIIPVVVLFLFGLIVMNKAFSQTPSSASPVGDFLKSMLADLNLTSSSVSVEYESPQTVILGTSDTGLARSS